MSILGKLKELWLFMKAEGVDELSRRFFVMNAFDGAMTILSIVVGALAVGRTEPRLIVGLGLASCFAMGVSGIAGTFMAERAERLRRLKELEKAMLTSLRNSAFNDIAKVASIYVALVDGLAPILAASIPLAPFIVALTGLTFPLNPAYFSILLALIVLFSLGIFLGRVSKENIIISGLRMLIVGVITIAICMLVGLI